ncbi:MAG: insulinase family protein [Clostridia bacterium]|nr:insulinase family protein [Clostridia bacterium]
MKKAFLIGLLFCLLALTGICEEEEYRLPEIGDVIHGFRLTAVDEIGLYHVTLYRYEHEKTGALLCHLANEDTNRAFTIGFHTPVMTDNGLPHVFEHAALGGSRKYPDPNLIYSMMYGTYSTYLNAYTSTTYTAFEASSLSEDQLLTDMDVFLSGVFHPVIMEDEHAMMREAYRYELMDRDSPITLEGVVYSEMLGAITQERMASQTLERFLYPGSCVGSASGGLPDEIPNMTYQELCDFHDTYYIPSNSLTMLYGDLEIERYLELIDRDYFSAYEKTEVDLSDTGYRLMEGDIKASITYPASADAEPETLIYYAMPVEPETAEEEYILAVALNIFQWPDHYMDVRISEEFPDCTWSASTYSNKEGVAIVFAARGIEADQADRFREICDEALNEVAQKGFDSADIRVYSDSARYTNAVRAEDMDGLSLCAGFIDAWDSLDNPWEILEAYRLMEHLTELDSGDHFDLVFRRLLETVYGHVLLISETELGGAERVEQERADRLAEMKAGMTDEELGALIARTQDYAAWLEETASTSMLKDVTVVTAQNLPEEVVRASVRTQIENGMTLISSGLRNSDYIASSLMLDASALPKEYLLPLRLFCLLSCRLETESRDRITIARDSERVANGLWFSMTTLDNEADKTWIPVFEIDWNTFTDLAEESVALIDDIVSNTSMEDIAYIRSLISSDALDRRATYKVGMPYSVALQEAARQTNEKSAYLLQFGGFNLIAYEESLVQMDDDALRAELQKAKDALSYVLHQDHVVLTVAGEDASVLLMEKLIKEFLSRYPAMGEAVDYLPDSPAQTGNTAFLMDGNVSYNLEYLTMEQLGMEYNAAMGAFSNLALDQVLMPLFRFENSVYSVFFQMDEDRVMIMTYRDPNLAKTFGELYPAVGESVRSILADLTQEDLDGYISSAYTSEAMPVGMIGRANIAIQSVLNHKNYFDEQLNNMRSLKALTPEKILEYADILDRLYTDGLKMTVTNPQKLEEVPDMFPTVNSDLMK